MRQFGKIFAFELKGYLKNKIFVGITIFLVVLIALVMFFPKIKTAINLDEIFASNDVSVMLIKSENPAYTDLFKETFGASFDNYDVQSTDEDITSIKDKITSGDVECAFIIDSPTSYTYYVNNLSMYDMNTSVANEVLQKVYQLNTLVNSGISLDDANATMNVQIDSNVENLGVDQTQNFFYTYIMIFALYMVMVLYGQMVATNVASEKSSRAMEVLITSAKPVNMMFGKVLASCTAGLLQIIAIFGSAILFYSLNKSDWDNPIIKSIFSMPISLFFYMLIFFVLGFLIYAFLYGAVASTASKLEDINTLVTPITFLFIIGFMVVAFSFTNGNVDNLLMKVCSFVPFTSSMAMFTRIAMSTVPIFEIIISIVILIISSVAVGIISAKIYRVGVLHYGTAPKFSSLLKNAIKSEK
ncbi:MAG: ABC transporter permease [Oscillospiraceae bacterium]|nr:ABC transporter permease [Oscillospiraceae bacterium]